MKRWFPVVMAVILTAIVIYIIRSTNNLYVLAGIGFGVLFLAMVLGGYYAHQRRAEVKKKAVLTQSTGAPIESPAGAIYRIEESTLDSGDPDEVMAATVHQVGDTSVGNTWIFRLGKWQKLMPERVLQSKPSPDILMGEVRRLAAARPELNNDIHLKLAVMGLMMRAKRLAS